MLRLPKIRLASLGCTAVAMLLHAACGAGRSQRDALRRCCSQPAQEDAPSQGVIDDDNLSQVMNQAESRHARLRR